MNLPSDRDGDNTVAEGMATLHVSLMRKVTATPKSKEVLTGRAGSMDARMCAWGVNFGTCFLSSWATNHMQMQSHE